MQRLPPFARYQHPLPSTSPSVAPVAAVADCELLGGPTGYVRVTIVADETPFNPREWLSIADTHVKQGETTEAIEVYRRVATYYRQQDFPLKAYAICKQMLVLDPTREDIKAEQRELAQHLGINPDG